MEEGSSGIRRTRSQVAPDWTVKDSLILVNEVAAVEADCSNALSSFQKWEIISENCNALEVHRTLNQCRRKWDALLSNYKQIKQWESQAKDGCSYWSLSNENRARLKLPDHLDNELFEAIDAVVMVQDDKAGTEPDSDPEAQEDVNTGDVIAEGPKRSRPQVMVVEEKPLQKTRKEVAARNQVHEKGRDQQRTRVMRQIKPGEEKLLESTREEEDVVNMEEEVETIAAKLSEKADLLHAIVAENPSEDGNDELRMKVVRRQGDELISCLGEIVNSLRRLSELAHEFD